jgi:hypothetical protein
MKTNAFKKVMLEILVLLVVLFILRIVAHYFLQDSHLFIQEAICIAGAVMLTRLIIKRQF